jgi:hypothetical protein
MYEDFFSSLLSNRVIFLFKIKTHTNNSIHHEHRSKNIQFDTEEHHHHHQRFLSADIKAEPRMQD